MERYPPGHLADRVNPDPQALDLERVLASSSRRRRQALLAVIIGACTIITCCLVGYWAYRTSREVLFRRVARENLTIAHTVANYIAEQPAAGDEDATNRALEQVRSFWHRFNHHASAAFLCVVKPNGEMVVCTANPSMEGSIVSDLALARPTPRGGTTISDLLAGKRDFWGENVILTGQQQVVGFCYSRILDCGVMVHLPTALVEEEVAAASRPWGGGIAVVAFLLIPLSLGLMHRSYSSAQRAADHATASLVASEAKYCDLYDNAPDMYASVNAQSARIEQCNETLARRLGYSKTEIIGRLIFDLYHPQSKEGAKRAFKDFVEAGEVHNAELRLECNDGSPLDVSLNVSSVRDANGKILHSRSCWRDITEAKQAEKELRLTQFAIEHSSDPIYWIRADGGIAYANQAACRALGYGVEELLSMSVSDFDPDFPREAWPEHWEQLKESGTATFKANHRTKQGCVFPVEITTNFLEHEGQEYIWAYARDITKHKEAEEQAARFSRVLENSLNEIYMFDAETLRFIEVNHGARENLGYSLEELRGLTPLDLKPELTPETFAERLEPLRAGVEEKLQFTTVHRRKDGTRYPIEVHLQLTDDVAPVFVAIILDITERERADEAVRESEERFRQLASSINQVFWLVSLDQSRVFYISPAYESVWGRSCESLYGNPRSWSDTIHPDDRASVIEALSSEGPSGKPLHYRIIKPGGEIRWIESVAYPVTNEAGEVYRIAGLAEDITERKRAEEELRLSAAITEHMAEGINLTRVSDGEIVFTNRVFDEMFGYEPGELSGRHVTVLNAEGDKRPEQTAAEIIGGVESNRSWTGEVFNAKKDGTKFWTRVHVSAFDHAKHGTVWLTVQEDITERKQAEESLRQAHDELEHRVERRTAELVAANAQLRGEIKDRREAERELRASEQRYRAVVEDQTELICRWKSDGRLLFVNDAYCRYFNRSRDELIGHSFMPRIPDEDQVAVRAHFASLSSAKPVATHQHRVLAPDGQVRWQQWTNHAVFDAQGRVREYQSVGRDITESRHAEQALKESEERFRRAVVDAPVPMMIHAEDGEILRINRMWTDLTGYHPEEIPTMADWTERAYGERQEAVQERIDRLYRIDGRVAEGEYTITTKDGRTIVWEFSSSPLGRLEDGRRLVLSIATDVTERKLAVEQIHKHQEELAHMSRLSTMGEMATGLAHELNQPLAAIVNYTQGCVRKLRAGGADTNELISILDEASDQAKRAGDIISRIRHFVRKKTLERVEVNVAELVRQVTGLLRNELQSRGVKLEVHIGNFLGKVQADRIQLQQVLVNLITNSMEAMEQIDEARRTVTLTASCDKDGLLAIRVADNGCGLPQGSDDEIFEPFYTTKSNGTGMGLAISRTIIEAHGGRLRATDNANGGCTFHFSLPTHTGASAGT